MEKSAISGTMNTKPNTESSLTVFFPFEWRIDDCLRWQDDHSEIMELDPIIQ